MNIDVELVSKPPYFHYIKPEKTNKQTNKNNIDLLFPRSKKHQENQIVQSVKIICQVSVLLKVHQSQIRLNLEVWSSECFISEMKFFEDFPMTAGRQCYSKTKSQIPRTLNVEVCI